MYFREHKNIFENTKIISTIQKYLVLLSDMPVVVCLEERGAGGELVHDAADAPHVAGVGPAQLQDHLGRAVVPGRHDLRKIFGHAEKIFSI